VLKNYYFDSNFGSTSFFSNSVKWHRPQYARPFPTDRNIPGPHLGQDLAFFVILSPSTVYFLYFADVGLLVCFFLRLIFDLMTILFACCLWFSFWSFACCLWLVACGFWFGFFCWSFWSWFFWFCFGFWFC